MGKSMNFQTSERNLTSELQRTSEYRMRERIFRNVREFYLNRVATKMRHPRRYVPNNFISLPNNLFKRPNNTFNLPCFIFLSAQIILPL